MKVGAVVQARMSSRRLPGKVLTGLDGRVMIGLVIERLSKAEGLDALLVATSGDSEDDAVAEWCAGADVPCHRGPLDDVAARLVGAAQTQGLDAIVRTSGDSPLIDQAIVSLGVAHFRARHPDIASNVHPRRSCPFGESVEVISVAALERARPLMVEPSDLEHVTPALYRNPDRFEIESFDLGEDLSGPVLTVDDPASAALVEAILRRMERPHWEYDVRSLIELRAAVLAEREGTPQ